jgi:parallel beta-helix repeat protein
MVLIRQSAFPVGGANIRRKPMFKRISASLAVPLFALLFLLGGTASWAFDSGDPYFLETWTGAMDATSDAYAEDGSGSAGDGPNEVVDYWRAYTSAYAWVPNALGLGLSFGRLTLRDNFLGLDLFSESHAMDATGDAIRSSANSNISTQDPGGTNGLFVDIGGDTPGMPVWVTYEVTVDATSDANCWYGCGACGGWHLGGGRDQWQPPAITLNHEIPVSGGYDRAKAVWQYPGPYGYHQSGRLDLWYSGGFAARVGDRIGLFFNAGAWANAWCPDAAADSTTGVRVKMEVIPPTEWYVDAANGTDDPAHGRGPGTEAWRTIHYAVDYINNYWPPGGVHILNVAEGTYDYAHEGDGNPIYIMRSNLVIRGPEAGPPPAPLALLKGEFGLWDEGIEVVEDYENIRIENLAFEGFRSGDGAAMIILGDHVLVRNCLFQDNDYGIYIGGGTGIAIAGNEIRDSDWAIYIDYSSPVIEQNYIHDTLQDGIYVYGDSSPVIRNNIIANTGAWDSAISISVTGGNRPEIYHNTLDNTGLPYTSVGIGIEYCDPVIGYNIISNFQTGIYVSGGNPTWFYNAFWQNTTHCDGCPAPGAGNIFDQDPRYMDAANGDYELMPGSPCINAIPLSSGDPVTNDIEDKPRPMGPGFDIGAFETPYTVTVTINPVGGGTVTVDPGRILIPPATGASFPGGATATLTAAPNPGYRFVRWDGDLGGSTANPVELLIDGDKSVIAVFVKQWTLTMTLGAGGASVSPGTGLYDQGALQISATALPDYVFLNWSGGYTGSDNPATILLNSDMAVTANFALVRYTLTTNVNPAGAGFVGLNPSGGIYDAGTPVQISANANQGYRFLSWSGDHGGSTNPDTVTMTSNKTVTANFMPQYNLTVLVSPEGTGTVDPAGGIYDQGAVVNPVPAPNEGYVFDRWVGDCNGETCSLTMNSAKTVVAYFKEVQTGEPSLLVSPGITELDYRMVSVPVDPADPSPSSVFGWGTSYNPAAMRVLRWDPAGANYLEGDSIPPVNLGVGYWLISQAERTLSVSGNTIPSDMDYYILLFPGWNQIGPPYPVDTVPWADGYVRVYVPSTRQELDLSAAGAWVENQAWGFDHGYLGASSLVPWSGYWVNNVGSEPVYLILNASGVGGGGARLAAEGMVRSAAAGSSGSGAASGISFTLQYKGYTDRTLFLGIDPGASPGLDPMDAASPPRFLMSYPRIYVNHPDWPRPGAYARDVRPLGGQPLEFLITIELPQSSGKKVKAAAMTLSWSGVEGLPANASVKLVDIQKKGKKGTLDMRTRSQYTIKAKRGAAQYQLKVVIQ